MRLTPNTGRAMAVVATVMALGVPPAHAGDGDWVLRVASREAGFPTIKIPAIGVYQRVSKNLNAGPAWWPVTSRPGGGDTIAIAGHRTTHTRPFFHLDKLVRGNRIYIRWGGQTHAYVVTSRRIVSESNLHIGDSAEHERLLLTACSRRDGTPTSAAYRLVVYALPITR